MNTPKAADPFKNSRRDDFIIFPGLVDIPVIVSKIPMLDEENLVPYATAWRLERHPRPLLSDSRPLVVAM